ncbi:MAG TPA: hypothetical protein VFI46_05525, partial [Jiangellaceae bacterium]|nr:hypothetical protein [Jiangellaceae bacterium]
MVTTSGPRTGVRWAASTMSVPRSSTRIFAATALGLAREIPGGDDVEDLLPRCADLHCLRPQRTGPAADAQIDRQGTGDDTDVAAREGRAHAGGSPCDDPRSHRYLPHAGRINRKHEPGIPTVRTLTMLRGIIGHGRAPASHRFRRDRNPVP